MSALMLKWFFTLAAYLAPFYFVWVFRRFWRVGHRQGFIVKILYWPLMWISGFCLLQAALVQHQAQWRVLNAGLPSHEEGMIAYGGATNVTTTWILTGWLSLVLAYLLGVLLSKAKGPIEREPSIDI